MVGICKAGKKKERNQRRSSKNPLGTWANPNLLTFSKRLRSKEQLLGECGSLYFVKMVITIYSNLHDLIQCAFGMLPSRGGSVSLPLSLDGLWLFQLIKHREIFCIYEARQQKLIQHQPGSLEFLQLETWVAMWASWLTQSIQKGYI